MAESFSVPLFCLIPNSLADDFSNEPVPNHPGTGEKVATSIVDGETAVSIEVSAEEDAPYLSDRLVKISGDTESVLVAFREVLGELRAAQGVGDSASAPFVMLVPSSAAPWVVGSKGKRVRELIEKTGAFIGISREIIPALAVQPVTIKGSTTQVTSAVAGVLEAMQELANRSGLSPLDFLMPNSGANAMDLPGEEIAATPRSTLSAAHLTAPPSTGSLGHAVFLVSMDIAGYVIGKKGSRIVGFQTTSGARINVPAKQSSQTLGGIQLSSLPGVRFDDRLIEVKAPDVNKRTAAIRLIVRAILDAPTAIATNFGRLNSSDELDASLTLLIPSTGADYIVGHDGQNLKDFVDQYGVDVEFEKQFEAFASVSPVTITGTAEDLSQAAIGLLEKVDQSAGPAPSSQDAWYDSGGNAGDVADSDVYFDRPRSLLPCAPSSAGKWLTQPRTEAENALLAGIDASGVLNHQLTMRVPRKTLATLDAGELAQRSGARLEVEAPRLDDPGHCYVTLVGQRLSTALAALYVQEGMERQDRQGID